MKEEIKKCKSLSDICRILKLPINGNGLKKAKKFLVESGEDFSHFDRGNSKKIKTRIEKQCDFCGKKYITNSRPNAKKACSRSCSNKLIPRGRSKDNEISNYRTICFKSNFKSCVVCGETKIVAVHHFDENHENNSIENLIPLCPTHHTYMHSRYKCEILDKVESFRKNIGISPRSYGATFGA